MIEPENEPKGEELNRLIRELEQQRYIEQLFKKLNHDLFLSRVKARLRGEKV